MAIAATHPSKVVSMEQQIQQQIEQQLSQQKWSDIRPQLLETFAQVSRADVDSARTAEDLVKRISDKTHYTERYVENRLQELATVGSSSQSFSSQPFSERQGGQQSGSSGSSGRF